MLDLLEDGSDLVEDRSVYVDVTALISSRNSAQGDKYGKSNLAAEEDSEKSLELHEERAREVLRRWKEVSGPLLPTPTVE